MKISALKLFFLLIVLTLSVIGQNQSFSFTANTLNISTDRGRVFSNGGDFSLAGIDANGSSISRSSTNGSFSAPFISNCIPCQKGSIFGNFNLGSWLTNGTAQNPPSEWTTFTGQISTPLWSIPIHHPRNRLLVRYIPVRLQGKLVIRLNTGTNTVTYTDPNVDLSGVMRVEFKQVQSNPKLFEWNRVQVTTSTTQ